MDELILRWIVELNPVNLLLEIFREPIYRGAVPSARHLGLAVAVALVAIGLGSLVFRRSSHRIPFYL